jgi:hypothetical protein
VRNSRARFAGDTGVQEFRNGLAQEFTVCITDRMKLDYVCRLPRASLVRSDTRVFPGVEVDYLIPLDRTEDDYLVRRDGRIEHAKKLIYERRWKFFAGSVERNNLDASSERETAAQDERRVNDAERLTQAEGARAKQGEEFASAPEKATSKLRRFGRIAMVSFLAIGAGILVLATERAAAQAAEKRTSEADSRTNVSLTRYSIEAGNEAQALNLAANFSAGASAACRFLSAALLAGRTAPAVRSSKRR